MKRTAIVYMNGERFVFRDEQVDRLLEIGAKADGVEQAWVNLLEYGKEIDA